LNAIRQAFKEDALAGRSFSPILNIRSEDKKGNNEDLERISELVLVFLGILFSEGHNWNEMRRFTLRNLRDFGMGKTSLEGLVQSEITELMDHLQ
jgi:hypothetical protein